MTISAQMFEQIQRDEDAWRRIERIAAHPDEATEEERAWLDRVLAAIDASEGGDWEDE